MELINIIATILSILYFSLALFVFFHLKKNEEKTLSTIGSYWGGILSPIPLIWLTLGYFSQLDDSNEYKKFIKTKP